MPLYFQMVGVASRRKALLVVEFPLALWPLNATAACEQLGPAMRVPQILQLKIRLLFQPASNNTGQFQKKNRITTKHRPGN